ncbi:hypothetical protein GAO09_19515 [Rhizobiales bacterium RZME27]|uniref:Uncharacterized protein n=1 Tax=Endobacterium cereale TaxID=2663029 RepID=A0A6A8AG74_9HYPH|nr:hypothetical protein [Endobacterium cereale]MQY48226.1 hypothetical protein [Endobacterium cereale]
MTDTVKHTPGPWKVFNSTDVFPDDNDREGERQIADCAMSHAMPFSEEQANALLIAAAPEFLLAAKKLIGAFDDLKSKTTLERIVTGRSDAELRKASDEAISELRAAIAKAEGRS